MKLSKDKRYAYIIDKNGNVKKRYVYHCCICKKDIVDYRPVRLVKQLFGYGQYKQYYNIRNYDFCNECWQALENLLFKWQKYKDKK